MSRYVMLRGLVLLLLYSAVLVGSLWVSYWVRFDFVAPAPDVVGFRSTWWWIVPMQVVWLAVFRQFAGLLSYFSVPDLRRLLFANVVSFAGVVGVWVYTAGAFAPPRGVILIDFVISLMALAGVRLGLRLFREQYKAGAQSPDGRARRVGIVGAGDVGASLARELTVKRGLGLRPVVFFDDDRSKWRSTVHDIPVVGAPEILGEQQGNLQLELVIIAMPSANVRRVAEVVKVLQAARIPFQTVPSLDQLATGKVKASRLRAVQIQDLLGREPVELEVETIRGLLGAKVVAVTGAGGSIGSELCRQAVSFNPKRLLMIEQSEMQLFQIEQELVEAGYGGIVVPLVADILDDARMRSIFSLHQPQILFHAAAHKHVPMMENQPGEAIKNNVFGTRRMADLAVEYGADRLVVISTDKAINPTSVMGATKRLGELYLQALSSGSTGKTRLMAVRFGNVLGSSGSVVPTFQRQIAAGGPVKVTHPEVTRYFMTLSEAAGLVLQSATLGEGGEIFVLDMGKPVKIVDLARQMIELSGLLPEEDIEIEFVGLRPGEKLFEEISHRGENIAPTPHPKVLRFVSAPPPLDKLVARLQEIEREVLTAEPGRLKLLLKGVVPEYTPYVQ